MQQHFILHHNQYIFKAKDVIMVIKKIKAFKKVVSEPSFEKQVMSSEETVQQARFEIGKIIKRLTATIAIIDIQA